MFFEVTGTQIFLHGVGDYWFQSDWMANEKTKQNTAAIAHAATYTLPFLLVTHSLPAIGFILVTHFLIDRFRLAKYLCYGKNFLAPADWWHQWKDCETTGYHADRPPWMTVPLMIIADNLMHIACNAVAIQHL